MAEPLEFDTEKFVDAMHAFPPDVCGAWILALCECHKSERYGTATKSLQQWALVFGCPSTDEADRLLEAMREIKDAQITRRSVTVTPMSRQCHTQNHARVTVRSRRMHARRKASEAATLRKRIQRNAKVCHAVVTKNGAPPVVNNRTNNDPVTEEKTLSVNSEDRAEPDIVCSVEQRLNTLRQDVFVRLQTGQVTQTTAARLALNIVQLGHVTDLLMGKYGPSRVLLGCGYVLQMKPNRIKTLPGCVRDAIKKGYEPKETRR